MPGSRPPNLKWPTYIKRVARASRCQRELGDDEDDLFGPCKKSKLWYKRRELREFREEARSAAAKLLNRSAKPRKKLAPPFVLNQLASLLGRHALRQLTDKLDC